MNSFRFLSQLEVNNNNYYYHHLSAHTPSLSILRPAADFPLVRQVLSVRPIGVTSPNYSFPSP